MLQKESWGEQSIIDLPILLGLLSVLWVQITKVAAPLAFILPTQPTGKRLDFGFFDPIGGDVNGKAALFVCPIMLVALPMLSMFMLICVN